MQPESQPPAPAVVAVVVTCDPGPWFEQALASLAEQDYPNLSILVIDAGSTEDPTPQVAAVLPGAFVRRLGVRTGFATAANEVLTMVEGASHLLLCHDDVALAPDALRLLVEEAFRSNAGITTPKYVEWEAPDRLLAVGATTDKVGVTRDLVEPGELDQEQHDAVRDVLVAPGGATLIRADLFEALGGFDRAVEQFGEDRDLSWRARVAGARVVSVPAAKVRHVAAIRRRQRSGWESDAAQRRAYEVEEANRIRSLIICYRWYELLWILPLALIWLVGEAATDIVQSRPGDGWRVVTSFGRAFRKPIQLWRSRRRTQSSRGSGDTSIRRLQAKGNSRFRTFALGRFDDVWQGIPQLPVRVAATGYEDPDDEPLAPLEGLDAEPDRPNRRVDLLIVGALLIVLIFGTRGLFGPPIPTVGQMPNMTGGWSGLWRAWWSGWQPTGLGSSGSSSPAIAVLALMATVLFGAVGTLQHVVVLGPLVVGPLGAYRAARWWRSRRGQMVAMVAYAIVPVPYNALARGHWGGLVAFAAAPWILSALFRLGDEIPFPPTSASRIPARLIGVGVLVALVASIAPSFLLVVPIIGVALLVGSALAGRFWHGLRMIAVAVGASVIALVALLPWSVSAISNSTTFLGPSLGAGGRLRLGSVLRFQTGPFGSGWLGWAFLAAAALPLLVGRGWRLAWAARLWSVALVLFFVVWAGRRGWFPAMPVEVVLAPAAAALAGSAALGAAAFELDLPGYNFGWRQLTAALAGVALALASIGLIAASGGGRWKLPSADADSVLTGLPSGQAGDYRILWVGAPDALPLAGRELTPGTAYATSFEPSPVVADLWPPSGGATSQLAGDLALVENRLTTKLGHLLAPASIRFIVIPAANGPSGAGSVAEPLPDALIAGLGLQTDLQPLDVGDTNYLVYENAAWAPARFVLPPSAVSVAAATSATSRRAVQGLDLGSATPVLLGAGSPSSRGQVPSGSIIYVSASRASGWRLSAAGSTVGPKPGFGWGMTFAVPGSGAGLVAAHLAYHPPLIRQAVQWLVILLWLAALVYIVADARSRRRMGSAGEAADPEWFVPTEPSAGEGRRRSRFSPSRAVDADSDEVWSDV
jgi:GT2 family glycosyltransferase